MQIQGPSLVQRLYDVRTWFERCQMHLAMPTARGACGHPGSSVQGSLQSGAQSTDPGARGLAELLAVCEEGDSRPASLWEVVGEGG